jgi:PLP dependent protein
VGADAPDHMTPVDPAVVVERLAVVRDRIRRAGGTIEATTVVAVTKTFGVDAVRSARDAGCPAIGENYAQELLEKLDALGVDEPRPEVHFIGRLQSNKVRHLASVVDLWQSVDRESVIDAVAQRASGARVLIQVNTTAEPGKGGCDPGDLARLIEHARTAGLAVEGLMTVGPTDGTPAAARPAFARLRAMCDEWHLPVCSMGMSHDLEVAVGEGSTMVRIGTALFGPR